MDNIVVNDFTYYKSNSDKRAFLVAARERKPESHLKDELQETDVVILIEWHQEKKVHRIPGHVFKQLVLEGKMVLFTPKFQHNG